MPDRSPEERERARLEREARRAAREARNAPAPPPDPPPAADAPPTPPLTGRTTSSPSAEPPPATGRQWRRAAGDPDAEPPLVRRVPPPVPEAREAVHGHDDPLPDPTPVTPPTRRIPPAPSLPYGDDEQAIGTRRVSAGHRIGRPHLPHRKPAPPAPRGPRPPGRSRTALRRTGALLALALVAAVIWFGFSLFQPFTGGGSGSVVVRIPRGAGAGEVGDLLAKQGVISSSFFFGLRARLEGKRGDLKAGTFRMKNGMSYAAALSVLTKNPPPPATIRVTIPEGRSRAEIATIARQDGIRGSYVAASAGSRALNPRAFGAPRGATLEGFLFPATYQLRPHAPAAKLVAEQLAAFRQNIAGVSLKRARSKNLSTYDVLVIASMIEREAGVAKDRPLIAAVIYNRLKDGMPLGIDATLRYALHDWSRPLTVSQLASNSPYNTRKHTGLPPTPIGNPGLASIRAAARPARVGYLFYVIKPCANGAHAFSSTDAQFQRDVNAYNAKRAQLGGKSPVTCK
jgi:UPF0755 protein